MSSAPEPGASAAPEGRPGLRRALFLDRDGTINVDTRYLKGPEQVELHQGVGAALALVRSRGFPIFVVTNQSGIERGLYTREAVEAIHARIRELLAPSGAFVDGFYYCPHAPATGCRCRKPGTLLFERAAQEHRLDLSASAVLGDRMLDVEAGQRLGMTTAFVPEPAFRARYPEEVHRAQDVADVVAPSVLVACHRILARG